LKWKDPLKYKTKEACEKVWAETLAMGDEDGDGQLNWLEYILEIIKLGHMRPIQLDNQKTTELYTDQQFIAGRTSLICDEIVTEELEELWEEWRHITWIRANEIHCLNDLDDGRLRIFPDNIFPDDIRQQDLGNCYFMSALSSLAENPERIRRLFVEKEINA